MLRFNKSNVFIAIKKKKKILYSFAHISVISGAYTCMYVDA